MCVPLDGDLMARYTTRFILPCVLLMYKAQPLGDWCDQPVGKCLMSCRNQGCCCVPSLRVLLVWACWCEKCQIISSFEHLFLKVLGLLKNRLSENIVGFFSSHAFRMRRAVSFSFFSFFFFFPRYALVLSVASRRQNFRAAIIAVSLHSFCG